MSVSTVGGKKKAEIIEDFKYHEKDTGSSEVQIALLTARINHLVEHLKKNNKDNHTRYGLLLMVGRRRRFLKYLKKKDEAKYFELAKQLKLKVK